jgi:hypothetical protein
VGEIQAANIQSPYNKLNLCKLKGEVDETRSVSDLCWSTQDDGTVDGGEGGDGTVSSSGSSSSDSDSSDDEKTAKSPENETIVSSPKEEPESLAQNEETPIPFKDPNVSEGVNMRSLLGFDGPKAGDKDKLFTKTSFSILGGSSAPKPSKH